MSKVIHEQSQYLNHVNVRTIPWLTHSLLLKTHHNIFFVKEIHKRTLKSRNVQNY